jgi:Prealbumin-like fold domain
MMFVRSRRPIRALALVTLVLGLVVAYIVPASASHPEASLPGSNFEIDVNANLKVDDPAPSIDWASVSEARKTDVATGTNDDSYAGGTKEDDACPGTTTGSIPNNKSDLLTFGAYVEPEVGGPGFLNLFWTRVQEPSGTTLMDFELNQSSTLCANGVNPVRTAGDLLIEYRIEQGGALATLKVRTWTGSAWGPAVDLTAAAQAAGTINSTPIPAAEADGLGSLSSRTFGEAQLDLDFVFDEGSCESFGSAFLKSRASDSFTSQLKDFIKPVPVNITNCGTVVIRKQTDPDENPNTTQFGYTKSFGTDPSTANTFQLTDDDSETFNNVLFGTGYTVTEDVIPAGWDFASLDCSASTGVTPSINGATVTFAIDNAADILDCTYTNKARATIIVEKVTDDGNGSFDFTSTTLTPSPFTLITTAAGEAGKDSETFSNLVPGTYDVAETVPAGWNLVSSSCDDGSDPGSIGLSAGETVTCTFHDARETGAIRITKTRKHAADGSGDHPHAGVDFTVTGGSLPAEGETVTTDANGVACVDGLLFDDYTVHEVTPAGYKGEADKTVTVDNEASCSGDPYVGESVSFHNTPLTDLTVSVNSQVDGGTASTITCVDAGNNTVASGSTGTNGDGSETASDLEPGTYTCEVVVDP